MDILWTLLNWLFWIYVVGAAIFIVLENRAPASTFAWILLFIALPVVGVLIYIFFGRDQRVFADNKRLSREELGKTLTPQLASIVFDQHEAIDQVKAMPDQSSSHRRLAELLYRTKLSILTLHNQVEILQDASVKYPRLEADVKAAQHSIHMQYFIWQGDEYMRNFGKLLVERAQAGVQVRILFDAAGSSTLKASVATIA